MNTLIDKYSSQGSQADYLSELAGQVLGLCRQQGADQAEVSLSEDSGLSVNVRMGEVETVERTQDRGVAVTVYFDQRKGTASTADIQLGSLKSTVEQACAIAQFTEKDTASGLADADRMATVFHDLDLWHPYAISADQAVEMALQAESSGREFDRRISNSDGASMSHGDSVAVYANSHGFSGAERSTHFSLSCSLIAGANDSMQRDYWYSSALRYSDLEAAASIGKQAAERTIRRMNPRSIDTGNYPVLFSAETARSLIGHFLGAVSGGALYRRASFLLDSVDTKLFPDWFSLLERPHIPRGFRSANFDAEGVATCEQHLVQNGVLKHYLLGSYSARKLGLQSTGNAGGVHNLDATANAGDLNEMIRNMGRGLLVTELMGQGVNAITGDYSRGAAGFWVEGGQIQYPVDEITIAGNLKTMFQAIEAAGSDVDLRSHIRTGSILIGNMTVAGEA
ncbi:MAG TPA: metalloprotease PmbA [Arenimonas sp.]|nr:metalloprotease PmbA [Arenimonas sp.]HOZ04762.1 metalloprotease PmbA [Arenimonas sp.]HPO24838.1 metalloprotease PmbA [Arenimonas sp.]